MRKGNGEVFETKEKEERKEPGWRGPELAAVSFYHTGGDLPAAALSLSSVIDTRFFLPVM